jgi:hypothetical protein
MATLADKLTLQVAAVTYKDMLQMVESEKRMRKDLLDGVSHPYSHVFIQIQSTSESRTVPAFEWSISAGPGHLNA